MGNALAQLIFMFFGAIGLIGFIIMLRELKEDVQNNDKIGAGFASFIILMCAAVFFISIGCLLYTFKNQI